MLSEEDFFASSPTANLVGITKKDTFLSRDSGQVCFAISACFVRGTVDMSRIIGLALILLSCVFAAQGQTLQPQDDIQSWNDVQLTVPISKRFDFQTKGTLRFGKNITRLNDGRIQFGIVWKPTKSLSISPFYWFIRARNSRAVFNNEHRFNLSATYKFPFKKFGLTHKSIIERRNRQPANTWRYRPSLVFDKDIPKKIIPGAKFFIGDEIFYDSGLEKFSRNRFSIGINKTVNKNLGVDIYYMRQNDGITRPGDLNVIWVAWRIKL